MVDRKSEFQRALELTGSTPQNNEDLLRELLERRVSKYTAWMSDEFRMPHWENKTEQKKKPHHFSLKEHSWVLMFFGVLLPLAAVGFETTTHYCAQHFFDPFPSPAHIALFCLIPLTNYLAWLSTRRDLSPYFGVITLLSGMAMGIGVLYSLMFLPITPQACFATVFLGFGLLGLAPLLSLPCSWLSGQTVCGLATRHKTYFNPHQVEHIGHLIVLVMVVAVELPSTLTRIHLAEAADPNPFVAQSAVEWLRQFGRQEVMLRACYERSGRATDILGSLYESAHPLNIDAARSIFYQVTGKPFNSVPLPASARATIQHAGLINDPAGLNAGVEDEFDLDADIAGEAVSGVARGLSVTNAKVLGSVDANPAVADLTWQFGFTNSSKYDREARAKVLLPQNAVIKKATLIVDNVERDATIMVRSAAREYYRSAVAERKNPLLVSTCGPDQILVQCFPVKPNSTAQIKLAIAAPLEIAEDESAFLNMPTFMERNFQIDGKTSIDITSTRPMTAPDSGFEITTDAENQHLTGAMALTDLARFNGIIHFSRDTDQHMVWTPSTDAGWALERQLTPRKYPKPNTVFIVIDGSQAMQQYMPDLLDGLNRVSELAEFPNARVTFVSDSPQQYAALKTSTFASVLDLLKQQTCAGGQNNMPAVQEALKRAQQQPGSAVLWIHAAQPIAYDDPTFTCKDFLKSFHQPLLYDMQVVSGPNEILNGVDATQALVRVSRSGSLSTDIARLFRSFVNGNAKPEYNIEKSEGLPQAELADSPEAKQNLSKIWGLQRILLIGNSHEPSCLKLAEMYQIVSPFSSAVVIDETPVVAQAATAVPIKTEPAGGLLENAMKPLVKAKEAAFEKVTSQLNNLSMYAGSASSVGSSAVNVDEIASMPVAPPPAASPQEEAEKGQYRAVPLGIPGPDSQAKSLFAEQKQALQGATNGTVGDDYKLDWAGVSKDAPARSRSDSTNGPIDAEGGSRHLFNRRQYAGLKNFRPESQGLFGNLVPDEIRYAGARSNELPQSIVNPFLNVTIIAALFVCLLVLAIILLVHMRRSEMRAKKAATIKQIEMNKPDDDDTEDDDFDSDFNNSPN